MARKRIIDGPASEEIPGEQRTRLAEVAVHLASQGRGVLSLSYPGEDRSPIFLPYRALSHIEIGKDLIRQLRELSDRHADLFPDGWSDDDRRTLSAQLEKLERSFGVLLDSEKRIRELGFKLDQETGEPKLLADHREKRLFAESVQKIYRAKYSKNGNTLYVRRKIADYLRCYPHREQDLDAGTGAPIYRAIYDLEKRLPKKVCKR